MKKKNIAILAIIGVLFASQIPVLAASNLMNANLTGYFHYIPLLSDTAEAYTFYGTNEYSDTAVAEVTVKAYKEDNSFNSSATITRYGWDAVSGEGTQGWCYATAKVVNMVKAVSTHRGKTKPSASWETETLSVYR